MELEKVYEHLRRSPAVHQLCVGAFIQEPLHVGRGVLAVPLSSIGFGAQGRYVAQYVEEVLGGQVDSSAMIALESEAKHALPVIALAVHRRVNARPEFLEHSANQELTRARQTLTWISGDRLTPFAMALVTNEGYFFRLLPPHTRRRQRLGFGNIGADFQQQVDALAGACAEDEHFELALALFHDAVREDNPRFRIARYFSVLECLAYKLKFGGSSRRAIRQLIGLEHGVMYRGQLNGQDYEFDIIEVAGRIRDALMHGARFREKDLNSHSRPAFQLYQDKPEQLADALHSYCEVEIARWANGASNGRIDIGPETVP